MKQMITTLTMLLLLPIILIAADDATLKLKIEGMTCGFCEGKMNKQLSSVCVTSTADSKKGEGTCVPKEGMTIERVIEEANKTGFVTTVLN